MMLQYLANGIVVGGIIAVTSVGLTLIYSILNLTNFAHGDMVTLGAYSALYFNLSLGWNPWAALPAAVAVGIAASVALEFLIWRNMRSMRASVVTLIIASIGLALAIRNLITFGFGGGIQSYDVPIERAVDLGLISLTPTKIYVVIVSLLLAALIHIILSYTTVGKAMRALSDNLDLAWVSGIDVDRVIIWAWVIGGALAAAGGVLYAMTRPFTPNLGWFLLLPMFAAVILGGIGNVYGALLGGFVIGIAQELSVLILPNEYKLAVGFFIMIIFLLAYPQGLLGEKQLT